MTKSLSRIAPATALLQTIKNEGVEELQSNQTTLKLKTEKNNQQQVDRRAQTKQHNRQHYTANKFKELNPCNKKQLDHYPTSFKGSKDWATAAEEVVLSHINELETQNENTIDILSLVKSIALIEEERNFRQTGLGKLKGSIKDDSKRKFPEIETRKDLYDAAINNFLTAVKQIKNEDDANAREVLASFGDAGIGYKHRYNQILASNAVLAVGVVQGALDASGALTGPAGPWVSSGINLSRGALGISLFYNDMRVGLQRLYFKGTEELVPLGVPQPTKSAKEAPDILKATGGLLKKLHRTKSVLKNNNKVLEAAQKVIANSNSTTEEKELAYTNLGKAFQDAEIITKAVNNYKINNRNANVEWAPTFMNWGRIFAGLSQAVGGTLGLGATIGLAPLVGPLAPAAGLLVANAIHLGYHFADGARIDSQQKLTSALLNVIKSDDWLTTSRKQIAESYHTFQNEIKTIKLIHSFDKNKKNKLIKEKTDAFISKIKADIKVDQVNELWVRPINIRFERAKDLFPGKIARAIHEAQTLDRKEKVNDTDKEKLSQLTQEIRQLQADFINFTNAKNLIENARNCNETNEREQKLNEVYPEAIRNIVAIQDDDFRKLFIGTLTEQGEVVETCRRLTDGEKFKYTATYAGGNLVPALLSVAVTEASVVKVGVECLGGTTIHTESLKPAAFAGVLPAMAGPEVGAIRPAFKQHTTMRSTYKKEETKKDNTKAQKSLRDIKYNEALFLGDNEIKKSINIDLERSGKLPLSVDNIPEEEIQKIVTQGVVPKSITLSQNGNQSLELDLEDSSFFYKRHLQTIGLRGKINYRARQLGIIGRCAAITVLALPAKAIAAPIMSATRNSRRKLEDNQYKTAKLLKEYENIKKASQKTQDQSFFSSLKFGDDLNPSSTKKQSSKSASPQVASIPVDKRLMSHRNQAISIRNQTLKSTQKTQDQSLFSSLKFGDDFNPSKTKKQNPKSASSQIASIPVDNRLKSLRNRTAKINHKIPETAQKTQDQSLFSSLKFGDDLNPTSVRSQNAQAASSRVEPVPIDKQPMSFENRATTISYQMLKASNKTQDHSLFSSLIFGDDLNPSRAKS